MLALLAYPVLFEPFLRLVSQRLVWTVGYGLCAALIVTCGVTLWRRGADRRPLPVAAQQKSPTWKRRARWVFLAFVPSSLMLGTTSFLSILKTP